MFEKGLIIELESNLRDVKSEIETIIKRYDLAQPEPDLRMQLRAVVFDILSERFTVPNVHIEIKGERISVAGRCLDLSRKKRLFQLFSILAGSPNYRCSRDVLVEKIYNPTKREISLRQMECLRHNLLKLISRARKEACAAFGDHPALPIDWLVYDRNKREWRLMATHLLQS